MDNLHGSPERMRSVTLPHSMTMQVRHGRSRQLDGRFGRLGIVDRARMLNPFRLTSKLRTALAAYPPRRRRLSAPGQAGQAGRVAHMLEEGLATANVATTIEGTRKAHPHRTARGWSRNIDSSIPDEYPVVLASSAK